MGFLRNLLPGNFERYLRGIEFPIGKQGLFGRWRKTVRRAGVVVQ